MNSNLKLLIKGVFMGIAEIIPGVSGSTVALIMGIYKNFIGLLHQISSFFKEILAFIIGKASFKSVRKRFYEINFKFGVILIVGMVIGLAGFSHVMGFLLENYPQYTFAFFFGLILASVSIPWSQMEQRREKEMLIALVTFLIFFFVLGLKPVGEVTRPSVLVLFGGGFTAVMAMVLPGISGSFVLLLLGLYHHVVNTVRELSSLNLSFENIRDMFAVFAGIVVGFSLFVRVLNYALHKYHSQLMALLVGLMLASLRVLWPFMDVDSSDSVETMVKVWPWEVEGIEAISILLIALLAFFVIIFFNTKRKKVKKEVEIEVSEAISE
jgi:putative membrane protein